MTGYICNFTKTLSQYQYQMFDQGCADICNVDKDGEYTRTSPYKIVHPMQY
jgi:hypothetical protein